MKDATNKPDPLPDPRKPDDAKLLAMLLGEIGDPEREELKKKLESDTERAEQLKQAADCIQESLTNEEPLSDEEIAALKFSDEEKREFFAQFEAEPNRKSKLLHIDFGHPLFGIGVAACFLFVLFSGYITNFRILKSPSDEAMYKLHELRTTPAPPEEPDSSGFKIVVDTNDTDGESKREYGNSTVAPLLQLESGVSTMEPSDSTRRRPVFDERSAIRSGAFQDKQFEGIENRETLAGSRLGTDIKDVGSAISVATDEFLRDTAATDSESLLVYTTGTEVGGLSGDFVDDSAAEFEFFSIDRPEPAAPAQEPMPSTQLVGVSTPSKKKEVFVGGTGEYAEEENFELSPFTVESSNNRGYRATSTLAGTRIRSEVVDLPPARYDFFTPDIVSNEQRKHGSDRDEVALAKGQAASDFSQESKQITGRENLDKVAALEEVFAVEIEPLSLDVTDGLLKKNDSGLALTELDRNETTLRGKTRQVEDKPAEAPKPIQNLIEYPEIDTATDALSTFSLNVSDVSYRLAESYLRQNALPPAGTLRTEEFVNAFNYEDHSPALQRKVGFQWERAHWPFAHDRDLIRFSIKTAATGRSSAQPLNLVLAIDSSGSMARPDRVEIINAIANSLGAKLNANDRISIVSFSREARLLHDGIDAADKTALSELAGQLNPQGGTDLESGLDLAYQTARRHFQENAVNRIILVTDGAANLGNTEAEELRQVVERNRKLGIALDCFGVGFDGHNDVFLESLSRNGDGRYGFLRSAEEAQQELGEKLAGMLRPAAFDVKVQVEFNPDRVDLYQQLGYQQRQIADKDFRNNAIDAAELGAAESGNAVYLIKVDDDGMGDIGIVRVRYRDALSGQYEELSWNLPYSRSVPELRYASPTLRLAAVAAGFAARLNGSPMASEIEYGELFELSRDLPSAFPSQSKVVALPQLIQTAKRLSGQP